MHFQQCSLCFGLSSPGKTKTVAWGQSDREVGGRVKFKARCSNQPWSLCRFFYVAISAFCLLQCSIFAHTVLSDL